jgi:ribosomal protein S18 acetylase RimI-like enzyme
MRSSLNVEARRLEYRRLTAEDAPRYWALRLEAVEREPRSFGVTPEEHRTITLDETKAFLASEFFIGAFDGEALVGSAWFKREPGIKERHKGHLRRVYVSASHRGRGVARTMIGALIDEVKKDPSCEQLLLAVGVFNQSARRTYQALGFVPFGIEPRALRAGDEYIDEEHMILFLR